MQQLLIYLLQIHYLLYFALENCVPLQVLPILKERMLQAELESRNICCPVFSPQIVGGDILPGAVTILFYNISVIRQNFA